MQPMSAPWLSAKPARPPRVGWWVAWTVAAWHLAFFATGAVTLALASSPAGGVFEGLAEPVHQKLLLASHMRVLAGYAVVALGAWLLAYPIVRLWIGAAPVTRWGLVARTLAVLGVLMAHGWLRLVHTRPYFLGEATYDTWYFQAFNQWPEEVRVRLFFVVFWFLPAVVLVAAAGVYVVDAARWFREGRRSSRVALASLGTAALVAAGWWLAPHFIGASGSRDDGRLNILMLSADALRTPLAVGDATAAAQHPHLAALAAESLVLTNMRSPLPASPGEAATLHTGQAPHSHGLQTPFPAQAQVDAAMARAPSLPAILESHGYVTAVLGDDGAGPIALARGLGFAEVEAGVPDAYPRHLAGLVYPAHFIIPAWLDNEFGRQLLPDLSVLPGRVSHRTITDRLARRLEENAGRGTPFFLHGVYSDAGGGPPPPADRPGEHSPADSFDAQISRLLECLEENGLRDNTILVLLGRSAPATDPAASQPDTGQAPAAMQTPSDTPLPVILHVPGQEFAPGEVDQLARLYDLAPTLIDVLGLPSEPAMDGVSLRPCLVDRSLHLPLTVYGESAGFTDFLPGPDASREIRAFFRDAVRLDPDSDYRVVLNDETAVLRRKTRWIRTPAWKLVFTPASLSSEAVDEWSLFDLTTDPHCSRDVKLQNPKTWQSLELALRRWADDRHESLLTDIFPNGEPEAAILPRTGTL